MCPNEKREITHNKAQQMLKQTCADCNVPIAVWIQRGQQMLQVQKQNTTDAGASLPPWYPPGRPGESALDSGADGHWMESWQMVACANL
jgi:hypothetical protein